MWACTHNAYSIFTRVLKKTQVLWSPAPADAFKCWWSHQAVTQVRLLPDRQKHYCRVEKPCHLLAGNASTLRQDGPSLPYLPKNGTVSLNIHLTCFRQASSAEWDVVRSERCNLLVSSNHTVEVKDISSNLEGEMVGAPPLLPNTAGNRHPSVSSKKSEWTTRILCAFSCHGTHSHTSHTQVLCWAPRQGNGKFKYKCLRSHSISFSGASHHSARSQPQVTQTQAPLMECCSHPQ